MPLKVEDALGRIFPVPSEYSLEELELIIQHRFREGPGHSQVAAENYELFNTKNNKQIIDSTSRLALLPGRSITMAILIGHESASDQICPAPRCHSEKTRVIAEGGRIWYASTCDSCYSLMPQEKCTYQSTLVASVISGLINRLRSENESKMNQEK
jgi:hypothetical protein